MLRYNGPGIDKYMMDLLKNLRSKSTCHRTKVAAGVISTNGRMTIAVNGGDLCAYKRCLREGAERGKELDHCRGPHAEIRAMMGHGPENLVGSTLYTTLAPCNSCARVICECGIKRVVYLEDYPGRDISTLLFEERGISIRRYSGETDND
jgi:dCMP deaminase